MVVVFGVCVCVFHAGSHAAASEVCRCIAVVFVGSLLLLLYRYCCFMIMVGLC